MTKKIIATAQALANKEEWVKRIKTFAWSVLWVAIAAVADHTLASLGVLHLPTLEIAGMSVNTAVIAGLVLTQLSKYARNMREKAKLQ